MEKGFLKKLSAMILEGFVLAFFIFAFVQMPSELLSIWQNLKDRKLSIEEINILNKNISSVIESRNFAEITKSNETTLAFVGDIMLDRGVYSKFIKNGNGDYYFPFAKIKDDLAKYDLVFGNLEGPMSDKGQDSHNLYSFEMDPNFAPVLRDIGFKVLSIANNHIDNWGKIAMEDTFSRLKENRIIVSGGGMNESEAYGVNVINVDGNKIAILSFSQFGAGQYSATASSSGIAILDQKKVEESVKMARNMADIVVVSFHFGEEYKNIPNDFQKKWAKIVVDVGADLVVGGHPHVVEPVEQYRNVFIAYSLGNFVFDQYFSPETMSGGLLEVKIKDKKIISVNLRKIQMNSEYQPELVE
ncbi:MAG: CapA family protein [Minisyncoccia bacterium]